MRKHGPSRPHQRSSWSKKLNETTVILNLNGLLGNVTLRTASVAAIGVVLRTLPYTATASFDRPEILAAAAGISVRRFRRTIWPEIEDLFERDRNGHLRLRHAAWATVVIGSFGDRQPLRHLYQELVAYWGHACAYCKTPGDALHIEHIVPIARGGSDALTNLTLACGPCNLSKGTRTAAEFGYPDIHDRAAQIFTSDARRSSGGGA